MRDWRVSGSRGRRPTGRCARATVALLLAAAAPFATVRAQVAVRTAAPDSLPVDSALVTAPNAGPVWDIDVRSYETRERVQHFVGLFTGKVREEFTRSLQRQTRYGAIIRQKLRDGGLPEDMTYLALIESWYDPSAISVAAAVGIWQFMAGTARGVGLRVDWWVDERRDPVRSTEGAVKLLSWLRTQFGSLYLAAAAYDGGDGRISRGLVRYASRLDGVEGEDRFFSLADTKFLRQETRDYVPKIIAAALVGKEPARYGVTVDSLAPLAFDTVRVPGGTPLAAVANAAGAGMEAVRELNLHLLRGMTPPGESMWVRVPAGTTGGFGERFAALDAGERTAVQNVLTKKGQSMSSIARTHGLTARQLGWYNPKVVRLKSGNLAAGQTLFVPTRETVRAATDVPNPSIERYPRRPKKPAKRPPTGAPTKPVKKPAEQFWKKASP
jgi:membrane-bound lytic murein transglycosylase D